MDGGGTLSSFTWSTWSFIQLCSCSWQDFNWHSAWWLCQAELLLQEDEHRDTETDSAAGEEQCSSCSVCADRWVVRWRVAADASWVQLTSTCRQRPALPAWRREATSTALQTDTAIGDLVKASFRGTARGWGRNVEAEVRPRQWKLETRQGETGAEAVTPRPGQGRWRSR